MLVFWLVTLCRLVPRYIVSGKHTASIFRAQDNRGCKLTRHWPKGKQMTDQIAITHDCLDECEVVMVVDILIDNRDVLDARVNLVVGVTLSACDAVCPEGQFARRACSGGRPTDVFVHGIADVRRGQRRVTFCAARRLGTSVSLPSLLPTLFISLFLLHFVSFHHSLFQSALLSFSFVLYFVFLALGSFCFLSFIFSSLSL
jgi:hypothetical protein